MRVADDKRQSAVTFTRRGLLLGLGQATLFGGLASRLYQIQVLEAEAIAARAEDNRTRQFPVAPLRGRILDATGLPLATNREVFRAVLLAQRANSPRALTETLQRLAPLAALSEQDLERLAAKARVPRREHLVIAGGLTFEQAASIQVRGPDLPGIAVEPVWQRA